MKQPSLKVMLLARYAKASKAYRKAVRIVLRSKRFYTFTGSSHYIMPIGGRKVGPGFLRTQIQYHGAP